ncbi:MAG: hypothetical protein ACSHYB_16610 [Roseibacillus sp.]
MKLLSCLLVFFVFVSCASEEKYADQPIAPWTYPISNYRVIKTLASRVGDQKLARLVGWDEGYYYFDWSHAGEVISRGTGRVDREQFDMENQGALTLTKGQITERGGKVRTLILE